MKKIIAIGALCLMSSFASHADDKYQHFASVDSPNLSAALCNLQLYNDKISSLVNQPSLTVVDMVKIHELTYTLENALKQISTDLTDMAEDLEKMHLASESIDAEVISTSGEKYLAATNALVSGASCD